MTMPERDETTKRAALVNGVGLTRFGRLPGQNALEIQARAAAAALDDAGIAADTVDAVIVGYATTLNHIMPANLLAEYLGIRPALAFGMNVGGATGLAMVAEASRLVRGGSADTVLVVGGEDRASGQSRDTAISTLAQVGHETHEVALGANLPSYYALLASDYLHRHGLERGALAPLAVQMRQNAASHPGAQFSKPISVEDVVGARLIAEPLGLLDCCPISDGGAAFVISSRDTNSKSVAVAGIGQTNPHQHVSEADFDGFGAGESAEQAMRAAGVTLADLDVFGIYDSFTITLAILLEAIGLAEPGTAGKRANEGAFSATGRYPLNLHGGLLSYGHSGVAGGMAHMAEVVTQIRGEAGVRQLKRSPDLGLLHADGGVLSAHVSLVLGGRHSSNVRTAIGATA
ncbi:thiolase family protein [Microbacterium sp. LRZ72]|uniref:thiolase family protein n=1 Tax=Microbacterium sp. LRZ72 TaxID=2942481 RepID=UPI0029ACAE9D|nr:thiolase family protein [Microbacterium sp. LRZ72]MDX2376116.1 thiolase family protein [Microbacterium sp. LRZ72]